MKVKFGQNFLVNERIAKKIVDSLNINSKDKILEIGGGKGILTKFLLNAKEVIVVEIDKKLSKILEEKFKDYKNLKILNCDFLKPNKFLKNIFEKGRNYKVIGNIPYNITSPILKILTEYDFFKIAVLTVQKEVGERIFSENNSRNFSKLTVEMQTFFDIEKLFYIKRKNFHPEPQVDSVVLKMRKKRSYFKNEKRKLWEEFLRKIFSKKRKMIKNSLFDLCKDKTEIILKKAGIPSNLRPEQIKVEDYLKIFSIIYQK